VVSHCDKHVNLYQSDLESIHGATSDTTFIFAGPVIIDENSNVINI